MGSRRKSSGRRSDGEAGAGAEVVCRLWKEGVVNGATWRVFLCTDDCPQGIGEEPDGYTYGVTVPGLQQVHLCASMKPQKRAQILGHELVHLILAYYNSEAVAGLFRCKPKDTLAVEEAVAAVIGSGMAGVLASLKPAKR